VLFVIYVYVRVAFTILHVKDPVVLAMDDIPRSRSQRDVKIACANRAAICDTRSRHIEQTSSR
jgi:hypothetical protein